MSNELQSVEIGFRKEGHFVPAPPTAKDFFAACAKLEDENDRLTAENAALRVDNTDMAAVTYATEEFLTDRINREQLQEVVAGWINPKDTP